MKVQGKVSRTQTVEGSISKAELLALVRESIHIPEGAAAEFYVTDSGPLSQLVMSGQAAHGFVYLRGSEPLRFRITWSIDAPTEQG